MRNQNYTFIFIMLGTLLLVLKYQLKKLPCPNHPK